MRIFAIQEPYDPKPQHKIVTDLSEAEVRSLTVDWLDKNCPGDLVDFIRSKRKTAIVIDLGEATEEVLYL